MAKKKPEPKGDETAVDQSVTDPIVLDDDLPEGYDPENPRDFAAGRDRAHLEAEAAQDVAAADAEAAK